jgi:hypothetical protein
MMSEQEDPIRTSGEFVEGAILEAVIPSATSIDLEEQVRSWDGQEDEKNQSIAPFLEQRQFLLLGKSHDPSMQELGLLLIARI